MAPLSLLSIKLFILRFSSGNHHVMVNLYFRIRSTSYLQCSHVAFALAYAVPYAVPYAIPDAVPYAIPHAVPHAVP